MSAPEWDWSRPVVDHLDLHASDFHRSVLFYETVHAPLGHRAGVEAGYRSNGAPGLRDYTPGYYAAYLIDSDGNNVEALYREVGNPGYAG